MLIRQFAHPLMIQGAYTLRKFKSNPGLIPNKMIMPAVITRKVLKLLDTMIPGFSESLKYIDCITRK